MLNTLSKEKRALKDKAIIIDERLMVSPLTTSNYTLLLPDHDIYYFSINDDINIGHTARTLSNPVYRLWQKGYEQVYFVGYKESCDIYYYLYNIKKFIFDSAVLVDGRFDVDTIQSLSNSDKDNNVLFLRKGKYDHCEEVIGTPQYMFQSIKTTLPLVYSPRVAREIAGWLEHANRPSLHFSEGCGSTFRLN